MRPFLPVLLLLLAACHSARPVTSASPQPVLRVATFNASLYSESDGGLLQRLETGDEKARKIAAVIQRQRPDVLLLNEFDFDAAHAAADLFQSRYLGAGQHGQAPIQYPYRYLAPVNTGEPSGMDLDRNGKIGGGNDAFGFGLHPGQYGMLVLSRYPIDEAGVRSFRNFLWQDLPGAASPVDPATGEAWYPPDIWARLRLSSKSHWDIPVRTPLGTIHLLAHHPTPPVFDGSEDRNGIRNRDEIRFWAEYLGAGKHWLCDDRGSCGGLPADAQFVIAGDHNADPHDGESTARAIWQLLEHPRVQSAPAPASTGAVAAALAAGGANLVHQAPHDHDTGDFGPRVGNLRVDYVLPSKGLRVAASGVFWPSPGEPGADWLDATDHHMVWIDLSR